MRFHALLAAGALAIIMPAAAQAAVSTYHFPSSYFFTPSGVTSSTLGTIEQGRVDYVGGNSDATTSADLPAFTVYQVNGAALLTSLGGTVSSINSLSLNLSDQSTGQPAEAAGSFVFSYASAATTPLSNSQFPASTPSFDTTQVGGLSNQFGPTDPLGTATYTPGANNSVTAYPLTGATGYADIASAIDSGSNFYVIVSAGTATTSANIGAYSGLGTFITPATLTINAAVPEPASLGILGTSGLLLLGRRRRQLSA